MLIVKSFYSEWIQWMVWFQHEFMHIYLEASLLSSGEFTNPKLSAPTAVAVGDICTIPPGRWGGPTMGLLYTGYLAGAEQSNLVPGVGLCRAEVCQSCPSLPMPHSFPRAPSSVLQNNRWASGDALAGTNPAQDWQYMLQMWFTSCCYTLHQCWASADCAESGFYFLVTAQDCGLSLQWQSLNEG